VGKRVLQQATCLLSHPYTDTDTEDTAAHRHTQTQKTQQSQTHRHRHKTQVTRHKTRTIVLLVLQVARQGHHGARGTRHNKLGALHGGAGDGHGKAGGARGANRTRRGQGLSAGHMAHSGTLRRPDAPVLPHTPSAHNSRCAAKVERSCHVHLLHHSLAQRAQRERLRLVVLVDSLDVNGHRGGGLLSKGRLPSGRGRKSTNNHIGLSHFMQCLECARVYVKGGGGGRGKWVARRAGLRERGKPRTTNHAQIQVEAILRTGHWHRLARSHLKACREHTASL
jgi:hypothetical protein